MWCASCQQEVDPRPATVGGDPVCPRCSARLNPSADDGTDASSRKARELLERWSRRDVFEPELPSWTPPTVVVDDASSADAGTRHRRSSNSPPATLEPVRVDTAHAEDDDDEPGRSPGSIPDQLDAGQHPGHDVPAAPPHFPLEASRTSSSAAGGGRQAAWGQLLAYIGVLGLTSGAALIIWHYFGTAPVDAPTAWLVATIGQMLLFLGVIMLVSGGIEQTTDEVSERVRILGEQLVRIEQAAHNRGVPEPKSPATALAEGIDPAGSSAKLPVPGSAD